MAAKKGNKYALGNPGGGRDPFYDSADEMQAKIDDYFRTKKIPTIPGLALHLGFADKKSLLDYEAKEEFWFPIKQAKLRIEAFNAEALHREKGNITGIIFTLKNLGWKDQQDIDLSYDLNSLSEEQLILISNNIINHSKK